MNRIRVLQVIPSFACGGAERMVVNLMRHLDERRFEVAAVSLAGPQGSVLEERLAERESPVWYLGKQRGFDLRMPQRIRNVIREFRPHLVHSHLCLHYVFPSLIGYQSLPHVATIHLPANAQYGRLLQWLAQAAFRRGVTPIGVSRDVAEWVKRVHAVKECLVIPNGIPIGDYQHTSTSREVWRKGQGFNKTDVLFVCVARLEKQKNHAMLLKAFASGLGAVSHARLLLAGDGACRTDLELQARELGLGRQIHFLGERSDISELLGAADVFVLASQTEGNPLSMMEAMAARLPIVATAVGGVPELVEDHRSGLLVRPGDTDGMADAMLRLLQDAQMRRTMAAFAAQRATRDFSAAGMAQGYADLYESSLRGGVPAASEPRAEILAHHLNQ